MTRAELIQLMRQCDLIDFRDEDDDEHVAQLVDAVEALVVKATKVEQEPFIWYDPETGVTWTNDALAEGYSAEGLIPLYAAPQPVVEDWAKPVAWMASDNGDIVHASQFEDAPGGRWDRPLYTHSQNLSCKSNQARLATLWGYIKEQPQQEQEWKRRLGNLLAVIHGDGGHYIEAHGWDKAQADAEERVARVMTGLPQSASDCAQRPRQPLTDEQVYGLFKRSGLEAYHVRDSVVEREFDRCIERFARAIERAHGIGGET